MDPRRAAHILSRLSNLLELSGVDRFRARAYRGAADAIRGLSTDDISTAYKSGALAELPGVGPATLSVLAELIEAGESSYLNRLLESIPEGLTDVASVPGLNATKAALLHRELDIGSLDELEAAARDGRLGTVRGFGEKTIRRVIRGIDVVRGRSGRMRYRAAQTEAKRSAEQIALHPDIVRVEIAGELRRVATLVSEIELVAECRANGSTVLDEVANGASVIQADRRGSAMKLRLADETELSLACGDSTSFVTELWRATGNAEHVNAVLEHAAAIGMSLDKDSLTNSDGTRIPITSEEDLYRALGMQFVVPELREGMGEMDAAIRGELPVLLTRADIRGVIHCHTEYSDGSVPIAEMAAAARERGWSYIGISDHSQAAFYAGGLKPDDVRRQADEIDRLNAESSDFTILKGIECDILADGTLDYDDALRESFDYVIGSIHSRFSMDRETMTARIMAAMDDPTLTVLAHPTGRLLLNREPYEVDLDAVIDKAAASGVTIELNADPSRLDLDWRWCRVARDRGVRVEIGPDAHSPRGLDHTWFGVLLARKAWLNADDVLNTRSASDIVRMARARR
jgi:DNA polymerase (family 10)